MDSRSLKLVVVGHVDHGKSTLIGRLLHETGSLPDGQVEALRRASERRGVAFEWSFTLDAMQAERDQAVTIETTRVWLRLPDRNVQLIDAPGHREFLSKMITGAAVADVALLVVDGAEGVQEQTRRHAHILSLLGIDRVLVAVNKMDLLDYDQARFNERSNDIEATLKAAKLVPVAIIPVVATQGENLLRRSPHMPWYMQPTLVEALSSCAPQATPADQPLRLPIADIYRIDQRRIYVGRIESGGLKLGDEVLFSPSNKTAMIKSIEIWPRNLAAALAGQSIGFTLDRPLFVERGEIMSHIVQAPLLNRRLRAVIVWLGNQPLEAGQSYRMQLGTTETSVAIETVARVTDIDHSVQHDSDRLMRDDIGEIVLHSSRLLALDDSTSLPRTARFVLRSQRDVVAGGLIRLTDIANMRPAAPAFITPIAHRVTRELRGARFGHRGGVLWFTGLSGAGKSTLAMAAEDALFRKGYATYVLDGDNVRSGLNADLGFQPKDRTENIRRVAEVAALFADAGFICITAFISPFAADRARARAAAGAAFHEVYINANLATCEGRDPRGLYRRARAGEIREFTGISSAYEPPEAPELIVDTNLQPVELCIEQIIRYIEQNFRQTNQE